MKYRSKKFNKWLANIALMLAGIALSTFLLGTILFAYKRTFKLGLPINSSLFSAYGNFLSGFPGVLIAFATFIFLYLTIIDQRENFKKQRENDSINNFLASFQNKILSSNIVATQKQYDGYNAIQKISSDLIYKTEQISVSLARRIIVKYPDQVDNLLLSDMIERIPYARIYFQNHGDQNFVDLLKGTEYNDRWELIKDYFDSSGSESDVQAEVLRRFGSRIFYKCSFDERKDVYREALDSIREKYSGFCEMYLQSLENFQSHIKMTSNPVDYYSVYRNSLTLHEEVILLYYIASKSCSPEFAKFSKHCGVFSAISSRPYLLFDCPSLTEIASEINFALNQWET